MAITNLTGYTWVGNDDIGMNSGFNYSINFTSNSINYTSFRFNSPYGNILYDDTLVFEKMGSEWLDDNYRTVLFTGGDDVTNTTFIAWLEENGTLTPPIENKKDMYVGGNKVSKVMVGDKAAKKILIGDKVIYESGPPEPSGYEVQITLQNALHAGDWESTEIYDNYADYFVSGNKIGEITSVNGTTTVTTTTGKIGIKTLGAFTNLTNTPTTTGGVSYYSFGAGGAELRIFFDVSGNGTVVVDGVDYDG